MTQVTVNICTNTVTYLNNVSIIPVSGISSLPPAGRLPYCLYNWFNITADQWVLEVVRGYKLELTSTPNSGSPAQGHRVQESSSNLRGSAEIAGQGGTKDSLPLSRSVPQQDLRGSKEGWLPQASNQPETAEPVHAEHPFQNGEPGHDEGPTEEKQLVGFNRSQRCLPLSYSVGRPPKIPPLYMAGHHVRVPVSSLRAVQCSQSFYQTLEAGAGTTTTTRSTCHNVSGRHVADGSIQGGVGKTTRANYITAEGFRLCGQQEEIPLTPYPINTISGLSNQFSGDVNQADRRESGPDNHGMQESETNGITLNPPTGQVNRENDSDHTSNIPRTSVVPGITTPEESGTTDISVIRGNGPDKSRGVPRIGMVGHWNESTEGEADPDAEARPNYRDRCLDAGMGSSLRRCEDGWPVITSREEEPHQRPGAPCCHFCREGICQGHSKCSYLAKDGQHHCCMLRKSDGRNPLHSAEQLGGSSMAMVSGEECVTSGRTSPRNRQLYSRRGIQNDTIHSRMTATASNLPANHASSWHVQRGSLCDTPQHTAGEICELEARSRGNRIRCTATDLDRSDGVCFSPILPDREMPQEGERTRRH